MTLPRAAILVALVAALAAPSGCGKKAPPRIPQRPAAASPAAATGTRETAEWRAAGGPPSADARGRGPSDAVPPAPPADPRAVATAAGTSLSWIPSPDSDVAGYRIWRRDGEGEWTAVTADRLVRETVYDDPAPAVAGRRYRITAVDRAGNESGPSTEVVVARPEP